MSEKQKPNPPPSEKMARKSTFGRINPGPMAAENTPVQNAEILAGETDALPLVDFDANESEFTDYAWFLVEAGRRMVAGRPQADATYVLRLMTALIVSVFEPH